MKEYLGVIGSFLIVIGLPTALIDMGINGARYAGWAPFGFGMAGAGLVLINL
jgi:hypothetical protein